MTQSSREELVGFFFQEVQGYIPEIKNGLALLETSAGEFREIGEIHRLFHNIKGAASQVYLQHLSGTAQLAEFVLEQTLEGGEALSPVMISYLGETVDKISEYCSQDGRDTVAESALLATRLSAFKEFCGQWRDAAGSALYWEIAQLLDIAPSPLPAGSGREVEAMASPSTGANDIAGNDPFPIPELEDSALAVAFADAFLMENPAENGADPETLPEGAGDFLLDEIFAGQGSTDEEEDEDAVLYEIFREECEDHLVAISRSLNSLEGWIVGRIVLSPEVREAVGAMRRSVHTLKGAAAMVGYEQLATCAHSLEDMLDLLYDHAGHIEPDDLRIIASAIDLIELQARQPRADHAPRIAALQRTIAGYLEASRVFSEPANDDPASDSGEGVEAASGPDAEVAGAAAPEEEHRAGEQADDVAEDAAVSPYSGDIRVKIERLDEIIGIEGELIVARSAMEGILNELMLSVNELNTAQGKLRRISQELESGFEVQSLYGFGPDSPAGQDQTGRRGDGGFSGFDPIELDRYSQLNLIIRSLNEISVDVNSIHAGIAGLSSELNGQIAKQQLIMGAMQDKLMRTRMTPMSQVSRAFFRTVRNTSEQLGKNVRLTVTGDDVYMDRFIWSKITDPIMHILRNCIDHGVESAAIRREREKPETAAIRIEAQQLGSFVVLRISDDGAGIDTDRLQGKLAAAGLVSATDRLSDEELLSYLFRTGFSTKDEISHISGRGVGLDVVRKNIQELRGTVRVETQPGQGAVFELRIPITLSVNRAILVAAGDRRYAIPLQDVVEIGSAARSEIAGDDPRLQWREELLPVKDLAAMLRLSGPLAVPSSPAGSCLTLVVRSGKGNVAVTVDAVGEQREIVVKNLGTHLSHVAGVAGVTILGDGSLIPVLNLSELVDESLLAPAMKSPEQVLRSPGGAGPLQVLIVDDSISVRQSIARLVRRQSWQSEMAVDGVAALEKLESFYPDAIVLDIEMPRMNGFEFMSILRNTARLKAIPVIMLTSRTSGKHRAKADELGVDFYLTKPFQDDSFIQLLEGIRRYRRPQ